MNKPIIKAFHDSSTGTISYVVEDPKTKNCAVIDSVLDFDISSGRISTKNADEIIEFDPFWIIIPVAVVISTIAAFWIKKSRAVFFSGAKARIKSTAMVCFCVCRSKSN